VITLLALFILWIDLSMGTCWLWFWFGNGLLLWPIIISPLPLLLYLISGCKHETHGIKLNGDLAFLNPIKLNCL